MLIHACTSRKDDNLALMRHMTSQPVRLQLNDSLTFYDIENSSAHEAYKIVVFVSNKQCSTCLISSFNRWNKFIDNLTNAFNVRFIFIVAPTQNKLKKTKIAVKHSSLNAPIYIDSLNVFEKANPQIPNNAVFHTFLLNNQDSILVVGDPLQSKKVRNMMLKQLIEAKQSGARKVKGISEYSYSD